MSQPNEINRLAEIVDEIKRNGDQDTDIYIDAIQGAVRDWDIISIRFTEEDVRAMACDAEVDEDAALQRAQEWGKHIADTATQLCSEQLMSVVLRDQP